MFYNVKYLKINKFRVLKECFLNQKCLDVFLFFNLPIFNSCIVMLKPDVFYINSVENFNLFIKIKNFKSVCLI